MGLAVGGGVGAAVDRGAVGEVEDFGVVGVRGEFGEDVVCCFAENYNKSKFLFHSTCGWKYTEC